MSREKACLVKEVTSGQHVMHVVGDVHRYIT